MRRKALNGLFGYSSSNLIRHWSNFKERPIKNENTQTLTLRLSKSVFENQ